MESSMFGTLEQKQQFDTAVEKYKNTKGALIPVLQEAQNIYGYLPKEVQSMVSHALNIPLADVYGVATFYSQFFLEPKGEYKIDVCMGTACYVKGAGELVEKFKQKLNIELDGCTPDGKFSLGATRCIGACGLAPVLTVNEDVHGKLSLSDVEKILEKYL